ncbi:MAG: hypothetical protein ACR2JE_07170 [Acidobacteriaceae bacterium]
MRATHMRSLLAGTLALAGAPALAQAGPPQESRVASDFRHEGDQLQNCKKFDFGSIGACAQTLLTGKPVHIAVGSLAPQNGFAAGLAFVEHKDFTNEWQLNGNIDAVASGNGSWRTGVYLQAFRQPGALPTAVLPKPVTPGSSAPVKKVQHNSIFYPSAPLFRFYAEATSLKQIYFFGLGPNSALSGQSVFGLKETITGISATAPFAGRAKIALLGELNGRFPALLEDRGQRLPSVQQQYDESSAPGIQRQPTYFQPTEGLRIEPSLAHDFLRLNYLLSFQQFIAASDSHYSFRRWTVNLDHQFPLYRTTRVFANAHNGPDSCLPDPAATKCPPVSLSHNLEGSVGVRLLISESIAGAGSVVPFYFQPTLGGSDLNGQSLLPSYTDYRFRAPNLLLLRESFEHSLWRLPVGFLFSVDEGKVAMRRDDIGFDHLKHSFTTGLTVRAGGLPVVYLLFAWGGGEGHHTIANVSPVLLGGSSRPSLF